MTLTLTLTPVYVDLEISELYQWYVIMFIVTWLLKEEICQIGWQPKSAAATKPYRYSICNKKMTAPKEIMNEHTDPYVDSKSTRRISQESKEPRAKRNEGTRTKEEREKSILEIELNPDFSFHKFSAFDCQPFITHR